eukprot:CAMPEP_0119507272 /NCGR_PEP_ID=MMETSP1344-20130328/27222_1 /TAXON_ID=236787 /ORGANISM="Florenciella parvula, Strain CCMP2471" /LENGTH=175 /DNA_ID=CAMNT_0007543895 /DNA_START=144 /DNA_END=668 /DNA_ORIENTATION=+
MTTGPLAVVLAMVVLSRKFVRKFVPARFRCTQHSALRWSIILAFLVLPSTSLTIFRTFYCVEMPSGERFLEADLAISCDRSDRGVQLVYSWLMILIYPLGIPASFFVVLYRQRDVIATLDEGTPSGLLPKQVAPLTFLYHNYKHGKKAVASGDRYAYLAEVYECLRRVVLCGGIV